MHILNYLPLCAIGAASCLLGPLISASEMWPLNLSSVHIASATEKLDATIGVDPENENRLVNITVHWNGRELRVPEKELRGIARVDLNRARVFSTVPRSRLRNLDQLHPFGRIVVVVEYNQPERESLRIDRYPRAFFLFKPTSYCNRDRLVPREGAKTWEIFYKDPGEAERSYGIEEYAEPDETWMPPSIPAMGVRE